MRRSKSRSALVSGCETTDTNARTKGRAELCCALMTVVSRDISLLELASGFSLHSIESGCEQRNFTPGAAF